MITINKVVLWDLGESDASNAGYIYLGEKNTTTAGRLFDIYLALLIQPNF